MNKDIHSLSGFRLELSNELSRRKSANPRYSLRAFARLLKMSPGFLSDLMKGNKSLSRDRAATVAKALGYGQDQLLDFCQLVQLDDLHSGQVLPGASVINLDQFSLIADWFHFALLDLTSTKNFKSDPKWIAARLGITVPQAQDAIARLIRVGALKQSVKGRLIKSDRHLATPSQIPNRALRMHHSQLIEKAKAALEEQSVNQREIVGVTLALDPKMIPIAKAEIARFQKRMSRLLTVGTAESVYQLNVQFFELTKGNEK